MGLKQWLKTILGIPSPKQKELKFLVAQGLKLGKNPRIHAEYPFDALFPWLISVGNNVCISSDVKILAHDTSTEYTNGYTKIGMVKIGDDVYLGHGVTVLCGVKIGDRAIVGAGSVVTSDIPEGCVYAGNPARFICTVSEFQKKQEKRMCQVTVFQGPCQRWRSLSQREKEKMLDAIQKNGIGYMS